jgi:hypothetical protein
MLTPAATAAKVAAASMRSGVLLLLLGNTGSRPFLLTSCCQANDPRGGAALCLAAL